MILFAGALVLGGLLGTFVYYGHADLLWLPVYILAGAGVIVAALAVVVVVLLAGRGVVALVRRRKPRPSVGDEVEAWLEAVS